jgi:hypothetical protein
MIFHSYVSLPEGIHYQLVAEWMEKTPRHPTTFLKMLNKKSTGFWAAAKSNLGEDGTPERRFKNMW